MHSQSWSRMRAYSPCTQRGRQLDYSICIYCMCPPREAWPGCSRNQAAAQEMGADSRRRGYQLLLSVVNPSTGIMLSTSECRTEGSLNDPNWKTSQRCDVFAFIVQIVLRCDMHLTGALAWLCVCAEKLLFRQQAFSFKTSHGLADRTYSMVNHYYNKSKTQPERTSAHQYSSATFSPL